jgi:hypothetical protein
MSSSWRRWLWLVPATAAIISLLALAFNALTGWEPRDLEWLLAPNSLWTLPFALGLVVGSLGAFWWARPETRASAPVVTGAVIAGAAVLLGIASYVPCTGEEARLVAPLTWSLALFAGEVHATAFSEGATCAGSYPLALQLARTLALAVTFAGAAAAGLTLGRAGVHRFQARRSGDADVVVGVSQLTAPVIWRLAEQAQVARRRRVIAVAEDPPSPVVGELRDAGVIVVSINPLAPKQLHPLLTRRGKVAVRRLYVLSDSGDHNRRVAATARSLLEVGGSEGRWDPAILVRLDDPREADSWRVGHALDSERVLMDAVSAVEVTAGLLVDLLVASDVRSLNLVGDGPMSLGILGDLAARRGWSGALVEARSGADDPLPLPRRAWSGVSVNVYTDDADSEMEWELLRCRSATSAPVPPVDVRFEIGHRRRVDDLIPSLDCSDVATVFVGAADPGLSNVASRLARMRPGSIVLVPDDAVVGIAAAAAHGRLFRYGLSLMPDDAKLPQGGWERMARLQHEVYRYRFVSRGQHPRPTQLPWDDLTDEVRDSNTDQIRSVLRWVRDLGYDWVADAAGEVTSELPAEALRRVAERMHESWAAAKRADGFVFGAENDTSARPPTSNYLLPWRELPAPKQRDNVLQVVAALSRARVFGLTPRRAAAPVPSLAPQPTGTQL